MRGPGDFAEDVKFARQFDGANNETSPPANGAQLASAHLFPSNLHETVQEVIVSYITHDHVDLYLLATFLRGNEDFRKCIKQNPKYLFLEDILPTLIKAADCVAVSFSRGISPASVNSKEFLILLSKITAVSGPPLLGLLPPQARSELVEVAVNFPYDNESSRFQGVSWLMKAGGCLSPLQFQQLKDIRQNIKFNDLIYGILIRAVTYHPRSHYFYFIDSEFSALATAVLIRPEEKSQLEEANPLQKIFEFAKSFPEWSPAIYTLQSLSRAMQGLPKPERHELFALTMKIGEIQIQRNRKMNVATIELFRIVVGKTKHLDTEELDTLIAFMMECKDKSCHAELLCSLIDAAQHLDERLGPALIAAIAEREEIRWVYSGILQIKQLSPDGLNKLARTIIGVHPGSKKAPYLLERPYLLGLLASQMEYLPPANRKYVVNAVLRSHDKLTQTIALRGAAASIVCLDQKDRGRLLEAIEKISCPHELVKVLRILVGTVNKNLLSLSLQ
jgi:hypothetical protein